MGTIATKAALSQTSQDLIEQKIDSVFFGNVIQSSSDAAYLARHVLLKSGIPIDKTALTINRLCGSGFETVIQGYQNIVLNHDENMNVCGGTENMSSAPLAMDGNHVRWGVALGKGLQMYDSLWSGLTDTYAQTPMAITAENLATKYNISRQECDEYALLSQSRWKEAQDQNIFQKEICPIPDIVKIKGQIEKGTLDKDEHPRPQSTIDNLSKLKPVFKSDGVVTAANASGICDGAGAIILASEDAVNQHNLKPLARIVSYGITGCDPTIMGIGPVSAIQKALHNAGKSLNEVDRLEINEAFAAQYLACEKELMTLNNVGDLRSKTNIHGGAISIGHPLAASGSRIMAHLANEIASSTSNSEDEVKYAMGAACIGGGQGIAILLEKV